MSFHKLIWPLQEQLANILLLWDTVILIVQDKLYCQAWLCNVTPKWRQCFLLAQEHDCIFDFSAFHLHSNASPLWHLRRAAGEMLWPSANICIIRRCHLLTWKGREHILWGKMYWVQSVIYSTEGRQGNRPTTAVGLICNEFYYKSATQCSCIFPPTFFKMILPTMNIPVDRENSMCLSFARRYHTNCLALIAQCKMKWAEDVTVFIKNLSGAQVHTILSATFHLKAQKKSLMRGKRQM